MHAIDRFFRLQEQGTTVRQEIVAGTATFLTMSYVVVVNPLILSDAGMGLNAFFTYGVVLGMGHPWRAALGAVFCSGVLFMALSASGLRRWILEAMPASLRLGIGAGIGLFLALIGLRNAGLVVGHPDTLITIGDLTDATVFLACAGFIAMTLLASRRIVGAIVISIIGITAVGLVVGEVS